MHTILNTESDPDKLAITYNNNMSQSHVISEQSCHKSRYMLLCWCRIHLAKYIHKARLFYHARYSSHHSSEEISKVNCIPRANVTDQMGKRVVRESS